MCITSNKIWWMWFDCLSILHGELCTIGFQSQLLWQLSVFMQREIIILSTALGISSLFLPLQQNNCKFKHVPPHKMRVPALIGLEWTHHADILPLACYMWTRTANCTDNRIPIINAYYQWFWGTYHTHFGLFTRPVVSGITCQSIRHTQDVSNHMSPISNALLWTFVLHNLKRLPHGMGMNKIVRMHHNAAYYWLYNL